MVTENFLFWNSFVYPVLLSTCNLIGHIHLFHYPPAISLATSTCHLFNYPHPLVLLSTCNLIGHIHLFHYPPAISLATSTCHFIAHFLFYCPLPVLLSTSFLHHNITFTHYTYIIILISYISSQILIFLLQEVRIHNDEVLCFK